MFRTYDSQWNRAGYSAERQYSGQLDLTEDYPPRCECGAEMRGCGDAGWIRFRGHGAPQWVADRDDYAAWCRNGHEMVKHSVNEIGPLPR